MGKARRRAAADAHAAALPAYQANARDRRGARRDLRQGQRANRQAYGALSDVLRGIGRDYRDDYRRLTAGYGRGIGGLTGMLNVGGNAVTQGAFGQVAASGLRGLGMQQSRGIEATRSARTQAGLEMKNNQLNLLAAFRDQMEELRNQRQDIAAQEVANRKSLTPQYRDQIAAQREQDELANWYREWLSRGQGGGGANPSQVAQTQAATNFQMADAGASSQGAPMQVQRTPQTPQVNPNDPYDYGFGGPETYSLPERTMQPRASGPWGELATPGDAVAAMAYPYQTPPDQVQGMRIPSPTAPAQPAGARDPFQAPPGYGAPPAGGPMGLPTDTPGKGYWYTDPMTGERAYSSVGNSPLGEIRYWEKVLPSVQGDPVLSQMVMGHIAELRQVVGR